MAMLKRAIDRVAVKLKFYEPILAAAKTRDISESDIRAALAETPADRPDCGKFAPVTAEFVMGRPYVNLAVKVQGQVRFLI
jgi:hypothetical protein